MSEAVQKGDGLSECVIRRATRCGRMGRIPTHMATPHAAMQDLRLRGMGED